MIFAESNPNPQNSDSTKENTLHIVEGSSREEVVQRLNIENFILRPDGSAVSDQSVTKSDFESNPATEALWESICNPNKGPTTLPSIKEVKRLGLAEVDENSDRGHFRFYPKGALVYQLIREWQEALLINRYEASAIKTPFIYSWRDPRYVEEAQSFANELYYVYPPSERAEKRNDLSSASSKEVAEEFVLRFGGDFGLFGLIGSMQFTHRQMPTRVYEFAESFRYEKSGNLRGINRARAFSFFDIHSICGDFESGCKEFAWWFKEHVDLTRELNMEFTVHLSVVKDFYEKHGKYIGQLAEIAGIPLVLEILSGPKHYWDVKYMFYDEHGKDFFNNQLDFSNGQRFDISYIDKDGKKQPCSICHASLGSMERWIVHGMERALLKNQPTLPLWLSPTQVRLMPIKGAFVEPCIELAHELNIRHGIRADVDDRGADIRSQIAQAHSEWCPYWIVYGKKEAEGQAFNVEQRGGERMVMDRERLITYLTSQTKGFPFRPLLPLQLSKRPRVQ